MPEESTSTPASRRRRIAVKLAVSAVLLFHLIALIGPPLSLQSQGPMGSSPSVSLLMQPVRWYCQSFYLDRGYAFFAPDPGPSHLIQAATTQPDGSRTEQMYPDRELQWPRLMYHRHFMLAEFLTEVHQPPGPPRSLVETDPDEAERWRQSRRRYEHVRRSIIDHLTHESEDKPVAIRRVEHLIPDFVAFTNEDISLTDRGLYRVLLDQPIVTTANPNIGSAPQELPVALPETIPPPTAEKETSRASSAESTEASP